MSFKAIFQTFDEKSEPAKGPARLTALRRLLKAEGLDGYLLPRADEYQNEYLPAAEERLAWLTGFTGSAGYAVILPDKAAVFSDGRYTLQLSEQTDASAYEAVDMIATPPSRWLAENAKAGQIIGYDAARVTPDGLKRAEEMAAKGGFTLKASNGNLVDRLWDTRPAASTAAVALHAEAHAGTAAPDKLAATVKGLAADGLDALLVTAPTSVAWLFNIRGGDVPHMPLPLSAAILPRQGRPSLYVDGRKLSNSVRAALSELADVMEPDALPRTLATLGAAQAKVRMDRDTASVALVDALKAAGGTADIGADPTALPRATKNATEIAGARAAQIRDAAAMCRFLKWFDDEAPKGGLTEIGVAEALETFRRETGALKDVSFPSISAAGPHAALPHYRVTKASNLAVTPGIFLIDSGGQYEDGTTDITRTLAVGKVTAQMKDRFTRVLKGMIAVTLAVFPKGASGAQLDTLARQFLWSAGLEFDHGTGHGVGSYLGVHEGPQRISKLGTTPLEPGMILSNEPGYYKAGQYGIRIENLIVVEKRAIAGGERDMHGFETLTFVPIDRRLIAKPLLTRAEKGWLDAYHAEVRQKVSPALKGEDRTWLEAACRPL
jgi:Xaa-Pro aminopeptidase